MSKTMLVYKFSGNGENMRKQLKEAEMDVTMKVDAIAESLAPGERWCDPDFGPSAMDPKGAKSLYRTGRRTRASLPDHNIIKWLRPNYANHTPSTENVLCEDASLFKGGHCSGDVIQGQLGDCWFISALAMLANETALLDNVFFCGGRRRKQFSDLMNPKWVDAGIWVLRFVDKESFIYVLIDDQLPTSPREPSKLVFARCTDPTELWVPIAEKAYAKYYGSYDSLTGGFSQIALRDLTGLCPEAVEVGNPKQSTPYIGEKLLNYLKLRIATGSLLGASCENAAGDGEGSGAQGLITGHAYSLLGVLPIETEESGNVNLVILRNPWGEGEWTGSWSDKSPLKKKYQDKIEESWKNRPKVANKNVFSRGRGKNAGEEVNMFGDTNNGVFVMDFKDFQKHISEVISAIDFPDHWRGRRVLGSWVHENSGGNSSLPTWRINPAFKLSIPRDNTRVFITLDQEDKRKKYGIKFPEYLYAIAFRIVPGDFNFAKAGVMPTKLVPNACENVTQISFGYSESCCIELSMKKGDVYIVPSTYQVGELGDFTVSVYCDCQDFELDCSEIIGQEEHDPAGGFIRHTRGKFAPLVSLSFDPKEYFHARRQLQQLVRDGGHDPNEIAIKYKGISPEENTRITSTEFREELANYGVRPELITREIMRAVKGLDRKLSKSDYYELFHNERFFKFRKEKKQEEEAAAAAEVPPQ